MSKNPYKNVNYDNCESCGNTYEKMCLLESKYNHFYCMSCFKQKFSKEKITQHKSKRRPVLRNKQFFPNPEHYVESVNTRKSASTISMKKSSSAVALSKRPLQCPHGDCNRFVSVTTLQSHFRYEHALIPNLITQFDARNAMEFYPDDIRYGITQCIVLFNIANADFSSLVPSNSRTCQFNFPQEIQSSAPVMILLASRIAGFQLGKPDAIIDELENEDNQENTDSFGDHREKAPLFRENDKVIIWLACNLVGTSLSYTIAASTLSNDIRVKYYGPLLCLGNTPAELCQNASCLILSHFHCIKMTENGQKPIALDIVIHED